MVYGLCSVWSVRYIDCLSHGLCGVWCMDCVAYGPCIILTACCMDCVVYGSCVVLTACRMDCVVYGSCVGIDCLSHGLCRNVLISYIIWCITLRCTYQLIVIQYYREITNDV